MDIATAVVISSHILHKLLGYIELAGGEICESDGLIVLHLLLLLPD